jgi:hypothetical protein
LKLELYCPVSMQHNLSLRSGRSVDGRPGGSGDGHHEVRLVCRGAREAAKDARVGWCGVWWVVGGVWYGEVWQGPWLRTDTRHVQIENQGQVEGSLENKYKERSCSYCILGQPDRGLRLNFLICLSTQFIPLSVSFLFTHRALKLRQTHRTGPWI